MTDRMLDREMIEAILAAPRTESNIRVAERVGCHRGTVQRYRLNAQKESEAQANRIRAEHTAAVVKDALTDLVDLRRYLREDYEQDRVPQRARVWLEAVRIELAEVAPDLAGMTDEELLAESRAMLARLDAVAATSDAETHTL